MPAPIARRTCSCWCRAAQRGEPRKPRKGCPELRFSETALCKRNRLVPAVRTGHLHTLVESHLIYSSRLSVSGSKGLKKEDSGSRPQAPGPRPQAPGPRPQALQAWRPLRGLQPLAQKQRQQVSKFRAKTPAAPGLHDRFCRQRTHSVRQAGKVALLRQRLKRPARGRCRTPRVQLGGTDRRPR